MVPDSFQAFFVASAGAGAALVGLLFVAISLQPERVFGASANLTHQLRATGAYLALVNAFLLSIIALIPGADLTFPAAALALVALLNTGRQSLQFIRRHEQAGLSAGVVTFGGLVIYLAELWIAYELMQGVPGAIIGLCNVVVGIYTIGLLRSWELMGGGGFVATLFFRKATAKVPSRAEPVALTPPTLAPERDASS